MKLASLRNACVLAGIVVAAACSNPEADKARYFENGNKHLAEARYAEAAIEFLNAIQIDPKFGEARLKLAEAYEKSNNVRGAAAEYIRAADAMPDHRDAQMKATAVLLLAGQYEDAKARASAFLQRHPQDVEMLLLHAQSLAALKEPESAIGEIEEALKVRPDESLAYVNLGGVQMARGQAKEAETAFRQAVTLAPKNVGPRLALGNFLWSAGRRDEAEQEIKDAIALEPSHALANRMLAMLYLASRRTAEAEQPLKVVAESGNPSAALVLADYYVGVKRYDDAKAVLTKVSADRATFADAESRLASIEYAEGKREEAHKRVDAALARVPKNGQLLQLKARWLTTEQKLDAALTTARAAVEADPTSAAAHYVLAVAHDVRGNVAEATRSYTEVLKLNPRAAEAQLQLSRLSLAAGNTASALQYAEGAKQVAPNSLSVRLALARSLIARGDLARATPEVATLMKALPTNPSVLALDGSLNVARGNGAAARGSYEKALAASPTQLDALTGLTLLDLRDKQHQSALRRLEGAIAKEPNNAPLLALAARAHSTAGNLPKAEELLRRSVAADPGFAQGYALLAQLYLSQKRLDEARAEFEGMVKRDASNVGARTMVGMILEAQNKREEARKWYEETVAVTDRAPVAANNLAFMYAEAGTNLDQALQLATSAKQQLPDNPDVDDTLGWVYYKRDLAPLAIRSFEASVEKNPKNEVYLYHLGLAYAKAGDKVKARDALERALQLNPKFAGADEARRTLASL